MEPAEGSDGTDGRWRIARKVAYDRVISTVDPQARHAHKTVERRQDGFKAHLVIEPDTGLATAVALTKASGPASSDSAVGIELLGADASIDSPVQVLADSAYGTGTMLAALDAAGHVPLVKPWPTKPAVPGGFSIDDFVRDAHAGTLTCPAQITRTISRSGWATFGRHAPAARCGSAHDISLGRSVKVHEHDRLQRAHRQRAADPQFQAVYRQHRPMVERTIAWLTRGARRVPYRGTVKNDAWLHHRAAALNLRRLLNLGLTFADGTWALA